MNIFHRKPFLATMMLAILLGFTLMGSRSLWEPDEGRYTNVALNIVDSNEWISLHRHPASLHFTKPPLAYWTIAASIKTFGFNTWAARLPMTLAYIFSVMMLFQLGKIFCREKPWLPALIFATSPFPYIASNYISTDFILAACETLAILCFTQYAFLKKSKFWLDAMWCSFGLAFLAKGPPGLLPLMAIFVFSWQQKDLKSLFRPLGFFAFAIVGIAWYVIVILRHPGLFDYFIGHEVIARVSDESMQRNPEWYGPLKVYLPVLLLGALPWLATILIRAVFSPHKTKRNLSHDQISSDTMEKRFLWLLFFLPLVVFCLSRSRMPLYLLPLFTPFALLLARPLSPLEIYSGKSGYCLLAWIIVLLGIRYGLSERDQYKDPEVFGAKVLEISKQVPHEIIFVEDMARYGLHLYLGSQINKVSFIPQPKSISDSKFDMTLDQALSESHGKRIFILKFINNVQFRHFLQQRNITPIYLGVIADADGHKDQDRLIYTIPGEF